MGESKLYVEGFFDPATSTVTYLLLDRTTQAAAIIDSVLDYDPKSGRTRTASADRVLTRAAELGARIEWILETHVHADHLSAAAYLKEKLGAKVAIGDRIATVQQVFGRLFNAGPAFATDGSQFDHLLADGDTLPLGSLVIEAWQTPGHTPACLTYVVQSDKETVAFVGDTLFMPDYGTARCDFPGGDAAMLYRSIRRILSLPEATTLYMCHDYRPGGREVAFETTVGAQRAANVHIHDGVDEAAFVAMRRARDAQLEAPVLLLPSVQVNMRGGELPPAEANGTRYLKIPLNAI